MYISKYLKNGYCRQMNGINMRRLYSFGSIKKVNYLIINNELNSNYDNSYLLKTNCILNDKIKCVNNIINNELL
jgi:hypothetical protein